jgi:hypothetical protein
MAVADRHDGYASPAMRCFFLSPGGGIEVGHGAMSFSPLDHLPNRP